MFTFMGMNVIPMYEWSALSMIQTTGIYGILVQEIRRVSSGSTIGTELRDQSWVTIRDQSRHMSRCVYLCMVAF